MVKIGFIISVVVFLFSCQEKGSNIKPHTDSVRVIYLSNTGYQLARAVDSVYHGRHFKDSTSLEVVFKLDTAWTIEIPNPKDTIKGPSGKPIYDSISKQYRFNTLWYKLTPQENANIKIQILHI